MLREIKLKSFKIYNYVNNRIWLFSLITASIVLAIGIFISIESNRLVKPNPDVASHYIFEPNQPLKFLANWDGADYIHIAKYGYDDKFLTGFFPLYPILIKIFQYILRSYLISGLIISWLSLWGAIYFYIKIVKEYFERIKKPISDNLNLIRAALYFVLFPSGIYLLCVYTESFYALLALATIYYAMRRKLIITSVFLFFAVIAHITGLFLIPLIGLMLLEEKISFIKASITTLVGTLGLFGYMIYLWIKFHNPYEFIHSQTVHHWLKTKIWFNFGGASILDIFLFIAISSSVVYWYKRKRSFSFYSLLFLLIPIIGGQFDGFARYSIMAFPVQFMLFNYLREKVEAQFLYLMILSSLWTYSVILFAAGFVTH